MEIYLNWSYHLYTSLSLYVSCLPINSKKITQQRGKKHPNVLNCIIIPKSSHGWWWWWWWWWMGSLLGRPLVIVCSWDTREFNYELQVLGNMNFISSTTSWTTCFIHLWCFILKQNWNQFYWYYSKVITVSKCSHVEKMPGTYRLSITLDNWRKVPHELLSGRWSQTD